MLKAIEIEACKVFAILSKFQTAAARNSVASVEPRGIDMTKGRDVSKLLKTDLDHMTSTQAVQFFVDYKASKGNYIVDADGNTILDMTAGGNTLPLGFNHNDLLSRVGDKRWDSFIANSDSNSTPSTETPELIHKALGEHAPKGLSKVHLFEDITGSTANDFAFRIAQAETGRNNVISFSGAHHGQSIATLSASSHHQKIDLPTLPWAIIDFPENSSDESRALESFESHIRDGETAAVIISPFQSQTFQTASNSFYQEVARIAHSNGTKVIVDETHTSVGATGKYWGHENWGVSADYVTFGRRSQVSGVWTDGTSDSLVENKSHTDIVGLLKLDIINGTIASDDLTNQVARVGSSFKTALEGVAGVSNVDGLGTQLAFDVSDSETNSNVQRYFRENGVAVNGAGPKRMSVTPSLTVDEKHTAEFISVLKKALS